MKINGNQTRHNLMNTSHLDTMPEYHVFSFSGTLDGVQNGPWVMEVAVLTELQQNVELHGDCEGC